eukprot:725693_1
MADIHRKTNQSQMKVVATAVEAGMHQTTKALEVEAERYDVGKDLLSPPARGRGDFMSGRGDTRRGMRGRGGRGGNMHRNEGNPITREARGGMTRNRPRGARVRGGGFMTRGIRGNRGGGQVSDNTERYLDAHPEMLDWIERGTNDYRSHLKR